jgi:chemotaxis protein histidine kinase CheA
MDATQKELLIQKGFDVEGTMRRFLNNEPLYIKCMKKFLDDKSFENLKKAYDENNCEECFKHAHTMKGFVSNLGINEMYHLLIPMVEKLRGGDINVADELKELEVLYKETYSIIEGL